MYVYEGCSHGGVVIRGVILRGVTMKVVIRKDVTMAGVSRRAWLGGRG